MQAKAAKLNNRRITVPFCWLRSPTSFLAFDYDVGIAGLHPSIDEKWVSASDDLYAPRNSLEQLGHAFDGARRFHALRARKTGEIDSRFVNALADPAVLDGSLAGLRHRFLVDLIVEVGSVIGNDEQRRQAVMRSRPKRCGPLQK